MFWRAFSSRVVRWQGRRSAELMANVGSTLPWMYYNRLTPFLGEGLTNKIWWEKLGRLKSTKIQWVIDIFVTEQSAGFINSCILKKKLGVKTWAVVFDNFNSMGLNTSNCFLYRSHCILLKDMLSNKQTSWGTKPPYMSFLFCCFPICWWCSSSPISSFPDKRSRILKSERLCWETEAGGTVARWCLKSLKWVSCLHFYAFLIWLVWKDHW